MQIPNIPMNKVDEVKELLLDAACYDGAHHKQEYVVKALEILKEHGFETGDLEEFKED